MNVNMIKINSRIRRIKTKLIVLLTIASFLGMSFITSNKVVHIYLAGDSTMADKVKAARPEMGWGTRMTDFFDSTVVIVNKARNGRSTKTFIQEGLWKSITDSVTSGDYVIIQFAHNDEVVTKAAYTTPQKFEDNLKTMISEVRKKKALPILITPVARRSFDSTGKTIDTHLQYAQIIRTVAKDQDVKIIDLSKESQLLLEKFGPEDSKCLFNHVQPGQNPNYPKGKLDDTHLNEFGARKMAQLVLADLRKLFPDLNNRVVRSDWKK
jgi:lysophospholipase L1-like esterase